MKLVQTLFVLSRFAFHVCSTVLTATRTRPEHWRNLVCCKALNSVHSFSLIAGNVLRKFAVENHFIAWRSSVAVTFLKPFSFDAEQRRRDKYANGETRNAARSDEMRIKKKSKLKPSERPVFFGRTLSHPLNSSLLFVPDWRLPFLLLLIFLHSSFDTTKSLRDSRSHNRMPTQNTEDNRVYFLTRKTNCIVIFLIRK